MNTSRKPCYTDKGGGSKSPPIYTTRALALVFFALLCGMASALIDDPVSTKTTIKMYQPAVMYEHTFFDMSILDGTSLVQADYSSTYFLARQCKQ